MWWWLISVVAATKYTIPGYYGSFYLDFDATGEGAESFYWSHQYTIDDRGFIFIADSSDHTVKRILARDLETGLPVIEELAGKSGVPGNRLGGSALLNSPHSTAYLVKQVNSTEGLMEEKDFLLIADTKNHCIKLLDIDLGTVTEFIGKCGVAGFKDGPIGVNRLRSPELVGVAASGNVYIMDTGNLYGRIFNTANETLMTLNQGACREMQGNTTIPELPYTLKGLQYARTANLRVKKVVCMSKMVKLFGEPSEHIYVKPEADCLEHFTTCGNRTNPLVQ